MPVSRGYISLGRAVWCQHGAFSGVGAFVVSFVSAECPVAGGMRGIFGKPLKGGFSEMYGLEGGPEPFFSENWPLPLTGWAFFACSSPVSDRLHRTPTPITPTYGHMGVKSFGWICCI